VRLRGCCEDRAADAARVLSVEQAMCRRRASAVRKTATDSSMFDGDAAGAQALVGTTQTIVCVIAVVKTGT